MSSRRCPQRMSVNHRRPLERSPIGLGGEFVGLPIRFSTVQSGSRPAHKLLQAPLTFAGVLTPVGRVLAAPTGTIDGHDPRHRRSNGMHTPMMM